MTSRLGPALCTAGGVGLLVVNHLTARGGVLWLAIVFLAPMVTLLGIGGLIDPRVLWSIGPRGKLLPRAIRIAGGCLALAGIVVSAVLVFAVYGLQGSR
jgi:hypothetical protein